MIDLKELENISSVINQISSYCGVLVQKAWHSRAYSCELLYSWILSPLANSDLSKNEPLPPPDSYSNAPMFNDPYNAVWCFNISNVDWVQV